MDDATLRLLRGTRTGLVASTSFALAAGAHLGAGGRVPSGLGLGALLTLTLVVAVGLARGPLRAAVVVPVVGGLQVALHHGFEWFTAVPAGASVSSGMATGMSGAPSATGHPFGGVAGADGATHAALAAATPTMASMHSSSMLAVHVVATLATTVLLVVGDRAARRTVLWWTAVLPVVLAVVAGRFRDRVRVPLAAVAVVPVRLALVLGGGPGRRGPPVLRGARTSVLAPALA
ncbi:hypothetical protein [Luteimicrobium subarcticum]|uniref:Uncharacterized protein n=1 Tax=Luteimicrobium subarcticum TaxID=620910 RepID=A0A2M8WRP4_9MICO|nr:hypothetical protein [Luteimicrobium subarcticum]PJI93599.1 hypothetical protein CLV34_1072 [Luteimicrobium subarcticum]